MPIVHMANNNDVTFPDGAVCPLEYRQQGQQGGFVVVTYATHHGLCLLETERNMRDDSDFFMLVWNPEKQEPENFCFASTRGWCYPCMSSHADATPEVLAAYAKWKVEQDHVRRRQSRKIAADKLRAERAHLRKIAAERGFPHWRIYRLRKAIRDEAKMGALMSLIESMRLRNAFRKSLQERVLEWLRDPSPTFASPLSKKQMDCL